MISLAITHILHPHPLHTHPHMQSCTHAHTHLTHITHDTQNNAAVKEWFRDWKLYFKRSYATTAAANKAYSNFKKFMKGVKKINSDATLPYWASGNA